MVLLGKFKGCGLVGGGVSLEADFGSLTFIHSYFTLSFLVAVWDASSRLFWPLCLPLVAITPFLNRLWTQEPLISSFSFAFTWNQITSPSCINPHPFSFLGQKACPRLLGRLLRKKHYAKCKDFGKWECIQKSPPILPWLSGRCLLYFLVLCLSLVTMAYLLFF